MLLELLCPSPTPTLPPYHDSQVLHYINALVSMQRTLLRDEKREEAAGASSHPSSTTAAADGKGLTCPVRYAAAAAAVERAGDRGEGWEAAGRDEPGSGKDDDEAAAWPDEWQEDAEAGVAVRDPSGRCARVRTADNACGNAYPHNVPFFLALDAAAPSVTSPAHVPLSHRFPNPTSRRVLHLLWSDGYTLIGWSDGTLTRLPLPPLANPNPSLSSHPGV